MNWYRIEADWEHFLGAAKSRWNKLTHRELELTAGRRGELARSIQEAYGITREASQRQIDQWQSDQRAVQGEDEKGERMAGPQDL